MKKIVLYILLIACSNSWGAKCDNKFVKKAVDFSPLWALKEVPVTTYLWMKEYNGMLYGHILDTRSNTWYYYEAVSDKENPCIRNFTAYESILNDDKSVSLTAVPNHPIIHFDLTTYSDNFIRNKIIINYINKVLELEPIYKLIIPTE